MPERRTKPLTFEFSRTQCEFPFETSVLGSPDGHLIQLAINPFLQNVRPNQTLFVAGKDSVHWQAAVRNRGAKLAEAIDGKIKPHTVDAALVVMPELDTRQTTWLFERMAKLLDRGGRLDLIVPNPTVFTDLYTEPDCVGEHVANAMMGRPQIPPLSAEAIEQIVKSNQFYHPNSVDWGHETSDPLVGLDRLQGVVRAFLKLDTLAPINTENDIQIHRSSGLREEQVWSYTMGMEYADVRKSIIRSTKAWATRGAASGLLMTSCSDTPLSDAEVNAHNITKDGLAGRTEQEYTLHAQRYIDHNPFLALSFARR